MQNNNKIQTTDNTNNVEECVTQRCQTQEVLPPSIYTQQRKRRRKALRRKLLLWQILLFTIVGGITFLIDYGIMLILADVLSLNLILANTISCTIAMICNYFLSMRFVFYRRKNVPRYQEVGIFILISLLGIGLSQLLLWLGTTYIHLSYRLVKVIATVIVTIFNFIVKKIVVSAK